MAGRGENVQIKKKLIVSIFRVASSKLWVNLIWFWVSKEPREYIHDFWLDRVSSLGFENKASANSAATHLASIRRLAQRAV